MKTNRQILNLPHRILELTYGYTLIGRENKERFKEIKNLAHILRDEVRKLDGSKLKEGSRLKRLWSSYRMAKNFQRCRTGRSA